MKTRKSADESREKFRFGGGLRAAALLLGLLLSQESAGAGRPLCADERDALRFLDFVTAPLPTAEERDWWAIGGRQFGLFSKRYSIAFAGYAAAALGQRGTEEERRTVGRILDNCIRRMLARDVWAYSQSEKYWGTKPWAPDPCYRENVMYTGHLLQLLALYEAFAHETKYWTDGFDFVWSADKVVHYTVRKLIDVTVEQMRENAHHGVTCEPGWLFFPCNNHPQVALRIFEKLGHGDWSAERANWESWALKHFLSPFFGGGTVKLMYFTSTGIFYPRGSAGLDGWSLLWYEPWATDRRTVLALWRKSAARIDWTAFDDLSDKREGAGCRDPQPAPDTVTAAFLAAAARACDDPETARRLERALDARYLVRADGRFYLNLNRAWRIAATAHRIISLAEANGSVLRELVQ